MGRLGLINNWIGWWTFVIAVCFILFLLFGNNWIT